MGLGICVQDGHVVNTVCPILPNFMDQEVTLLYVSSIGGVVAVDVVYLDLDGFAFDLFTVQPANMRGLSRT